MPDLWGAIYHNERRGHWAVTGKWQGKRLYFSQIPAGSGFLTCTTREHAAYLQVEISKEIARGIFRPERFQKARPLHLGPFAERWLAMVKPSLAYKTWQGYRSYVTNWIAPQLGAEYLPDLSYEKILTFLNGIERSAKFRKNVYGCLRKILNDARKSGYISQLPEPIEWDLPVKKIEWLSRENQEKVLAELAPAHRPIIRFMMLTGVRPSEARALRKQDIRRDEGYILIASTFALDGSGHQALKVVKNKREQAIPLYAAVAQLLEALPASVSPFVFINPDTGQPYSKNINRDYWNPACLRALGYVFPLNNSGRHSFANQLLEAGVDLETVSTLLRHSSTAITKDSYARPNLKVIGGVVDKVQGRGAR